MRSPATASRSTSRVDGAPMGSTIEAGTQVEVRVRGARPRRDRRRRDDPGRARSCIAPSRTTSSRSTTRSRRRCRCASNGAGARGARWRSTASATGRCASACSSGRLLRHFFPCLQSDALRRASAGTASSAAATARLVDPLVHRAPAGLPRKPEPERRPRTRGERGHRARRSTLTAAGGAELGACASPTSHAGSHHLFTGRLPEGGLPVAPPAAAGRLVAARRAARCRCRQAAPTSTCGPGRRTATSPGPALSS